MAFFQELNRHSDIVCLSYYPLGDGFQLHDLAVIEQVLDHVVEVTENPFIVCNGGAPSSDLNGPSEALQADFISATFRAWDKHADRVRAIDFTWANDVNPALLAGWQEFFGSDDPAFVAFLASLGLRQTDGTTAGGRQPSRSLPGSVCKPKRHLYQPGQLYPDADCIGPRLGKISHGASISRWMDVGQSVPIVHPETWTWGIFG